MTPLATRHRARVPHTAGWEALRWTPAAPAGADRCCRAAGRRARAHEHRRPRGRAGRSWTALAGLGEAGLVKVNRLENNVPGAGPAGRAGEAGGVFIDALISPSPGLSRSCLVNCRLIAVALQSLPETAVLIEAP